MGYIFCRAEVIYSYQKGEKSYADGDGFPGRKKPKAR